MEEQSNRAHRPSKAKKKHTGGMLEELSPLLVPDLYQIAIQKLLALQTQDVWQKLLLDRMTLV
jgi:hypothetical protein